MMHKELLDELMDAGLQFSLRDCELVEVVGSRIDGERAMLLDLLGECYNVISAIEPDDGDEAEQLRDVLDAIERAESAEGMKKTKDIKWTTK